MFKIIACISFFLITTPFGSIAQQYDKCSKWEIEAGAYLALEDSLNFSLSQVGKSLIGNSEVVFCPAGIERASQDDIKKRLSFDWEVKYNNIYMRSEDGIVFEGMNEHGFSASLMFLSNSQLPEKNKRSIPIAASLAVNFFIDHFKCVDTALLAVWDIRIYDDIGLTCGWPFRIILHDSTGLSAYIEYVNGKRQVFTYQSPSFVVGGPDISRLITLEYIPEAHSQSGAEQMYLDILDTGFPPNLDLLLLQYYIQHMEAESYFTILRYPLSHEMNLMLPSGDEARFDLDEIEFIPGQEVTTRFF